MLPKFRTIAEAVANVGTYYPDNSFTFQDLQGEETKYSFVELEQKTAAYAKGLQDLGLTKGDRVGLVVIEPEDFILSFLACIRVGVVPVPMYPPLSFGALDAYAERTQKVLVFPMPVLYCQTDTAIASLAVAELRCGPAGT